MKNPWLLLLTVGVLNLGACALGQEQASDLTIWENYTKAGKAAIQSHDFNNAESLFTAAMDVTKKASFDPEHLFLTVQNLADVYADEGKYDKAQPLYEQALAQAKATFGTGHPNYEDTLVALGKVCEARGQYAQAADYFKQALELAQKISGKNKAPIVDLLRHLALNAKQSGNYDDAQKYANQEIATIKQASKDKALNMSLALWDTAQIYQEQSNYEAAVPLYQRALTFAKRQSGTKPESLAQYWISLATCYQNLNQFDEAEDAYKQAIRLDRKNPSGKIPVLNSYAALLKHVGKTAEAENIEMESQELQAAVQHSQNPLGN